MSILSTDSLIILGATFLVATLIMVVLLKKINSKKKNQHLTDPISENSAYKKTTEQRIEPETYTVESRNNNQFPKHSRNSENSLPETGYSTQEFYKILEPASNELEAMNTPQKLEYALLLDSSNERSKAIQVLESIYKNEQHQKEQLRFKVILKNYSKGLDKLLYLLNKYPTLKEKE